MKKLVLVAAAMVFSVGLALSAAAADAPKGPVKVTNFGKKGAPTFDHSKHADVKCEQCHHNAKDGKFKCGECHKLEAEGNTPKIQDAMHGKDKGVCFACHRADDAKKKMKCADCHGGSD